ncbi:site-specific integrase [Flagellimonas oceani]|uniref:Site-specific integrase n=2 Tax=Flagellimonas oceani TaxID=2698672 RepID=A0A6G7J5U8_9FLAO|nr:site-specific integrase [Allomuricauda oceani]QII46261.1 site-specific integrase [Allomuricauda oceani]
MDIWTLPSGWDKRKQRLRRSKYINQDLDCDTVNFELEEKMFVAKRLIDEIGLSINKVSPDRLIELITKEWDKNSDSEIKHKVNNEMTLIEWGETLVNRKMAANVPGSATWLRNGMRAITKFNGTDDIKLYDITVTFLRNFEAYHLGKGNSINCVGIYLRAVRSIYNSAINEDQFVPIKNVFQHYRIPPPMRTKKRALKKEQILKIRDLEYEQDSALWHARNYAMIMFYCRGMNFVDLVKLKVENIRHDRLYYGRSKTRDPLSVHISEPLAKLLQPYLRNKRLTDFLFPTNYDGSSERFEAYKTQRRRMNERLRIIAKDAEIDENVTTYTIRHSWATIAKYLGVSTALISEAMGHNSIITTEVYLKSFDNAALDHVNEKVIL